MKRIAVLFVALCATSASAQEKTVTLTQQELTALVNAQVAKAMNQLASEQAKAALEKVQKAFDLSTAPPSRPTRAEK